MGVKYKEFDMIPVARNFSVQPPALKILCVLKVIIIIMNLNSAQLNMHELRIKKRNKLKNSVLFMLAVGILINTGVAWTGEDFEGTVANPISSITDESSSETSD